MQEAFQRDLAIGKTYENHVLEIIKKTYPLAKCIEGRFKPYDIIVPEIEQTFEVKLDKKSLQTGNILVEIGMFGKPSALLTTKADWWIIATTKEFYWIKPIRIVECIITNNIHSQNIHGFGDDQCKLACLIEDKLFRQYCSFIQEEFSLPE